MVMLRPAVHVVSPLRRTLKQAAGIVIAVWAGVILLTGVDLAMSQADDGAAGLAPAAMQVIYAREACARAVSSMPYSVIAVRDGSVE
jgi:hypothetical protein